MSDEQVEKKNEKDIEVMDAEQEIDQWCKLTPKSNKKSIDDIELDAWCDDKADPEIMEEKKKMNK